MKHLRAKPEAVRQPSVVTKVAADANVGATTSVTHEVDIEPSPKPAVMLHSINDTLAGQRLDHFLVRVCKTVPKSHLYRVIRNGEVRVNGKRAQGERRLEDGDVVRVPPIWLLPRQNGNAGEVLVKHEHGQSPIALASKAKRFEVLYEDDFLLAINKPEGVAVHGGSGVSSGVIEQIRAYRPELSYLELVHRIDKETSGVLLLAKKRMALVHLQQQFSSRTIAKHYRVILVGKVPKRTKTLDGSLLIRVLQDGQKQVSVNALGVAAITRITGIAHVEQPGIGILSLVDAKIETGRTHQIRVHAAHQGWPIVGDQKYGNFELNKLLSKISLKRMFLHAFSIDFYHPEVLATGSKRIHLSAPLPMTFTALFPELE
jgi:23S rRNA pseudouridine955/2504/2580 synthase